MSHREGQRGAILTLGSSTGNPGLSRTQAFALGLLFHADKSGASSVTTNTLWIFVDFHHNAKIPPLCRDFDKYLTKMRLDSLPPKEGDGVPETLFKISILLQRVFPLWLFGCVTETQQWSCV